MTLHHLRSGRSIIQRYFNHSSLYSITATQDKFSHKTFHRYDRISPDYFKVEKSQHRALSIKSDSTRDDSEEKRKVCLIVGAGAGIGEALTRRFTKEGYITVVARRDAHALKHNVKKLQMELMDEHQTLEENMETDFMIIPRSCDARKEHQVVNLFKEVEENVGEISVCIFNVGANISFPILETTSQKFYKCWEMACYSGFLVGREAARFMTPRQSGTIIFTGATASTRGAANFAAFSVAKSGLRALSQSMARELGPKGVHVSHVIIDAAVDTPWIRENFSKAIEKLPADGLANPDDIADAYWHLASQQKSAWTHEMDLRPYCERF